MKKIFTATLLVAALLAGCAPRKAKTDAEWLRLPLATSALQLDGMAALFADSATFARSIRGGVYKLFDIYDWTSGFFPGSLWMEYALGGGDSFADKARDFTARLAPVQHYTGNHDIGFMMMCSYGNQLALTGDTTCIPVLVNSSNSLLERYREDVGLIRSWDFGKWNYPVIIDNMMNLEMLFWAWKHTGDPKYKDVAVKHADATMKNHYRPDHSSYHVVSYNDDGTVESRGTFQGYADESVWARGQAWGLYGFTMCYRCTGLERYLEQARHIAAFIMDNPAIPADKIPYWDYNAPDIPNAPRDASAAAITASALLELSTMTTGEESAKYLAYAGQILKSLSSAAYLAEPGTNGYFILTHSTGHLPAGSEVDTPLNYADYYYLEAIKRYLAIQDIDPATLR